ncbi:serine hydrolase [Deinococcus sp. JMULE3]|uniref:serine hydrolase domain-containing protein n=1 Tax=Deinococcus sp. JMULE3 TaxID=2518341 RepID=UPI001575016B|nr:serine hydrolase [Deinococcus sp. JMULE3]NTX99002.1 class C beta-lactamase-related serine hydrolase [Deinococcus sp. JMULE3]
MTGNPPGPDLIPERTARLLRGATGPGGPSAAALGVVTGRGARSTLTVGHTRHGGPALSGHEWWDLASLTKPLLTARELLRAAEDGLLDLDDPLGQHLPDLAHGQDAALRQRTLRQLLTHSAGLGPWARLHTWGDEATIRHRLLQEPWEVGPAGPVRYSDLGYVLLGSVLERVRARPLRGFTLDPGLTFSPDVHTVSTEVCAWRGRLLTAETHDENAAALGGTAGHAGLFGTLNGVLDQAERLLRGGWLSPAAQALALRPQVPERTLAFVHACPGWSGGSLCSPHAVGHTGFTGTGLWVDPPRGLAWVLLTNRVHPTRHTRFDIQGLRRAVGNTLAAHHTPDRVEV